MSVGQILSGGRANSFVAGVAGSRPGLAGSKHQIFEGSQLLGADGPARMQLARGNADLGPHAEFAAVGKLRRRVVQHDGAIDSFEKCLRRFLVARNDGIGMARAVPVHMAQLQMILKLFLETKISHLI